MEMNGKAKYYIADESGNQVKFVSASDRYQKDKKWWRRKRTRLEIILLVVCGVCLSITLFLIILEATRTRNLKDASHGSKRNETKYFADFSSQKRVSIKLQDKEETIGICMTEDCIKAGARLINGMNQQVEPCDDFFEYACGNWNKMNIIPDDRSSYNTFAKLREDLQVMIKDLLEQPITDDELSSTRKAKNLYRSCINENLIDQRGIKPVKVLLEGLDGWPVTYTNHTWDETDFDLIDLMVKLRLYNNKILLEQWVSSDDKNSDVNIIQLDQPDLGMPSREYYLKGPEDPDVQVYQKFAIDVALLFGANKTTAEKDMREMIELEIKLANITVPQEQRRDTELMYNKMMVKNLTDSIKGFDFLRYLKLIFDKVNLTITEAEEIVVYAPEYLIKMVDIVKVTPNRTLANYLIWRIMMNRVTNLPEKYRDLRTQYHKKIYGSDTERSRWRECVSYVNDNMGNAVGRLFVTEHFDEDAKNIALDMIHDIRIAFHDLLEEVPWMDEKTRIVAKEKADAMAEKIGYPSHILNDTALDESYEKINFHADKYFENVLENIRNIALDNSEKLRKPVDKTRWSATPVVVNAFYSSTKNQILFPAGILQPPFYSKGYPKSLNYGGIGMVIGHEITHGFDDRGRQFDKDGNLKQWWDNEVIDAFKNMAQCIVNQYSNYTLTDVDIKLNGVQTQGENIADNGGLKEAYKAYEKWMDTRDTEPDRLPGLENLSNKQLFFLNFAQVWCGSMRPEAAVNRVRTGMHSPGRFRVIGTLQNSVEFSEVFGCPLGSNMNPVQKCQVW